MKQLVQHLGSGSLEILDVPCPQVARGHLLIRSRASVISAGTERMLVEFARANLLQKSKRQPQRVQQAIDKIKTDGLWTTLDAIRHRLDQPLAMGYSNLGEVIGVGEGVEGFQIGDRVASNGPHAEVVHVPRNLCVKIPDTVGDEQAAFAVLASIPLQGIRLLKPELGETVVVYGLGLLGLLAVQLLSASGVNVVGIDLDAQRLSLAESFGAKPLDASEGDPVEVYKSIAGDVGADALLITASARNDQILRKAASIARKRGRIVLVGDIAAEFDRDEFYRKELSLQVSCSYGPGRYDPSYEQHGVDYPLAYVRWTEQRNLAAVVELMAQRKLDPRPLVTRRIAHTQANEAYDTLLEDRSDLAILLQYPASDSSAQLRIVHASGPAAIAAPAVVGVLGAGQFTRGTLLPALAKTSARLKCICSSGGLNAAVLAKQFSFESAASDNERVLADDDINTVIIATRHDQHASLTVEALRAGKTVFVEKPLAIDREGLAAVRVAYEERRDALLHVGFNRRFSRLTTKAAELLRTRTQPATAIVTVNAGHLPVDHWIHDSRIGGGRIIGEACHWIDLLCFLFDSEVAEVHATAPQGSVRGDQATISMKFRNGCTGTVHYLSSGHRTFPKERIDLFCQGRVLTLDNFRKLTGVGWPAFRRMSLWRQEKGHRRQIEQFIHGIDRGGPPLISPAQLWNVSEATFCAMDSLENGTVCAITTGG